MHGYWTLIIVDTLGSLKKGYNQPDTTSSLHLGLPLFVFFGVVFTKSLKGKLLMNNLCVRKCNGNICKLTTHIAAS